MRISSRFFLRFSLAQRIIMSSSLPIQYNKPWLSIADQVKQLEARGLVVADRAKAEAFIEHTSYYRFSGYCLAFENTRHVFSGGTNFELIKDAYVFDANLRDLFREATELIEVDLRSIVAHAFGEKHGAFGHIDATKFHPKFKHSEWLSKLQHETKRSSEIFVNHFRRRYRQFPDLPIWATTEVMSFGALSLMISGMWKSDRQLIARKYKLSPKQLGIENGRSNRICLTERNGSLLWCQQTKTFGALCFWFGGCCRGIRISMTHPHSGGIEPAN
jgi:abortive infection bacteriophage resistance protein